MNPLISRVVTAATGRSPHQFQIRKRPPLPIQSNHLYDVYVDGHHYIAKEYRQPDELEVAPAREYKTLQRLAHLDIAPQPLFFNPGLGPVILYEFLLGTMWNRQPPDHAGLMALARVWLQLHQLDTTQLWPSRGYEQAPLYLAQVEHQLQHYRHWLAGRQGLSARLCEQVVTAGRMVKCRLEKMPAPLHFCKSDTRFANIIARPDGRVGMVDWEDAGLHDPACSIADLRTHPNQEDLLTGTAWKPFLDTFYAETLAADPTLPERVALYEVYLSCVWIGLFCSIGVQRAQAGELTSWRANGVLVNERLRRFLARVLAGPAGDYQTYLPRLAHVACFPP